MSNADKKKIKCVVWDLDNTVWDGILLEEKVSLRSGVAEIIATLDKRGILQSIASRNNHEEAMAKLAEFGLADYFLYPQIKWAEKSDSIRTIAEKLNIGIDTFAFIDDQPYEREEVNFALPNVMCIDALNIADILAMPEMNPRFITEDSSQRRLMYLSDMQRQQLEETFEGPKDTFLATLQMVLTISPAKVEDLQRAEELTVRTNQLNTTGKTYSYDELDFYRQSPNHLLLMADLDDKYGTYGKIGLTLIERQTDIWRIKLLLMSCRVMSRGVGSVLINHLRNLAKQNGVRLQAEFIANDRNRMMYMTYKFANFKENGEENGLSILENDLSTIPPYPNYLVLNI